MSISNRESMILPVLGIKQPPMSIDFHFPPYHFLSFFRVQLAFVHDSYLTSRLHCTRNVISYTHDSAQSYIVW